MRRVADLLEALEEIAPVRGAEPWDNVGLLCGSAEGVVLSAAAALDASEEAVRQAAARGDGALIVHHPLIFSPLKAVTLDTPLGRTIAASLALGVSVVAAHTNWDRAEKGLNCVLGSLLGLCHVMPLVPASEAGIYGDGLVGELPEPMEFQAFEAWVREAWGLSWAQGYRKEEKTLVRRVALVGGAGGSFRDAALTAKADLFITADVRYHERLDALSRGLSLLVVDHGEMEAASLPFLAERLQERSGVAVRLLQ